MGALGLLAGGVGADRRTLDGRLGVDVDLTGVDADGVMLDHDERIDADLKVWAAGIKAPDFLKDIAGLETNRLNQLVKRMTALTLIVMAPTLVAGIYGMNFKEPWPSYDEPWGFAYSGRRNLATVAMAGGR